MVLIEALFFQQRYIILDATQRKITQKQTGQSNSQKEVAEYSSTSVN